MQPHTPEFVLNALERATELAKRLPSAGPAGISSTWPEILRLGNEGYIEKSVPSNPLTASEMQEYETTSSWMSYLKSEADRKILWAYAAGMPGWKIANASRPKVSQSTVSRRILWALTFIAIKLDMGEKPPGFQLHAVEKYSLG